MLRAGLWGTGITVEELRATLSCPNKHYGGCKGKLVFFKKPVKLIYLLPESVLDFLSEASSLKLGLEPALRGMDLCFEKEKSPEIKSEILAVCPECGYFLIDHRKEEDNAAVTLFASG